MKYEQSINILDNMFKYQLSNRTFKNISLNISEYKYVLVYGAGSGGAYTKYLLSLINVEVFAFLDAKAEIIRELDEIQVCLPDSHIFTDEVKNNSIIIISVGNPEIKTEIEQMLFKYGYPQIVSYIELFNEVFLMADCRPIKEVGSEFFYENKQDIMRALCLLEDQESLDIYCGFVKGHALQNNEYFAKPVSYPKYIPQGIKFTKGYDFFVDCGAARGETYITLEKNNIIPETLIMFEPDKINFSVLVETIKSKNRSAFLYPCAVYSKMDICSFSQTGTQGSSLRDNGKDDIQCLALDDVLVNVRPTFIKMDIEGGEYEALLGAKSTIIANKPDLAICVYHSVNHIWDIPIFLNNLDLGYKIYLRSGNIYGMNTVLYATVE